MTSIKAYNIVYSDTTQKKAAQHEDILPMEIEIGVSEDWFAQRWFNDQTLLTKQILKETIGYPVVDWSEE